MAVRREGVQSGRNLQCKDPEKSVLGALSCNEEVHVLRVKGNVIRKATGADSYRAFQINGIWLLLLYEMGSHRGILSRGAMRLIRNTLLAVLRTD